MTLFVQVDGDAIVRGDVAFAPEDCEVVTGVCRVVTDPFEQREEFEQGEVLLASSTTPDYVPIMRKASAVVTNMGGLLQHAAHFAREERKPCIVGTGFATSAFADGERISLDLSTGEVTLAREAAVR
jgi:pyruvate, water dikinase